MYKMHKKVKVEGMKAVPLCHPGAKLGVYNYAFSDLKVNCLACLKVMDNPHAEEKQK